MNLCTDCRYIGTNASGDWEKYRCFAPENDAGTNLVSGAKEYKLVLCKDVRYPSPDMSVKVIDCVAFEVKPLPPPTQEQMQTAAIDKFKSKLSAKKQIGLGDL